MPAWRWRTWRATSLRGHNTRGSDARPFQTGAARAHAMRLARRRASNLHQPPRRRAKRPHPNFRPAGPQALKFHRVQADSPYAFTPGPVGAWPMHCVLVGHSMRSPDPDTRGFTLVELAVTILVLGLLFAMGIPAIRSMSGSYQLQASTENIAAQLRLGRERAIATGQVQHFHLWPAFGADYYMYNHSTGFIPARWKLPRGITYYSGGGSTLLTENLTQ